MCLDAREEKPSCSSKILGMAREVGSFAIKSVTTAAHFSYGNVAGGLASLATAIESGVDSVNAIRHPFCKNVGTTKEQ